MRTGSPLRRNPSRLRWMVKVQKQNMLLQNGVEVKYRGSASVKRGNSTL